MPVPGRRLAHEPASPYLGVVLILTLLVAGVLAYQAHRAALSRRETAERVLRDYASFAAWQLAQRAPGDTTPFAESIARRPLLPPSLTGGAPNDSLLSVAVVDNDGHVVFESARRFPGDYTASQPGDYGLTYRVTVRPDALGTLVIGGLPSSRLPLLYGLLVLCAALVALALVQLRREYELARLRQGFVSGVSHELRTPLAQIRLFAETLRLGRIRSDEERAHSIEVIDREARRLTNLVDNVLQFSRAERGVARVSPEPADLAARIGEIIDEFAPLAAAKRATLTPALLPGLVVPVDPGALRQILVNLLDNAVKYGPAGQTVRVGTSLVEGRARITIEDQGPGIPAHERGRVFEPYHRLEREADSAVAGGGIGLAVVRELAELHGGRAWVDDAAGGGSRFVVELPHAEGRS